MEPQSRAYTYTLLCNLFNPALTRLASKTNVYGVIRGPVTTDINDPLHCSFEITDKSLSSAFSSYTVQVSMFTQQGAELPDPTVFRSGRIIRLHRAVVETQEKSFVRLEGRVPTTDPGKKRHGYLSWVIFDETTGSVIAASSEKRTHSKEDEQRVQQLVKWSSSLVVDSLAPAYTLDPSTVTDEEQDPILSGMQGANYMSPLVSGAQFVLSSPLPGGVQATATPLLAAAAAAAADPLPTPLQATAVPEKEVLFPCRSNLVRLIDVHPTKTPFSCVVYVCFAFFFPVKLICI